MTLLSFDGPNSDVHDTRRAISSCTMWLHSPYFSSYRDQNVTLNKSLPCPSPWDEIRIAPGQDYLVTATKQSTTLDVSCT
jgi:hypothetical protein